VSTTYVKPASNLRVVRRSGTRRTALGVGGALAAVTAVGAAVAIFLAPAAPRALPAMDASLGYADMIDARPAISRVDASPAVSSVHVSHGYFDAYTARAAAAPRFGVAETAQGYETVASPLAYGDLATIGIVGEYVDGAVVGAAAKSYADLATVPGPNGFDEPLSRPLRLVVREGAQGYETVAVPLPSTKPEPTGLGFWDLIE
jgi:hypothetical protein